MPLTQAQIAEHVGRMMQNSYANYITDKNKPRFEQVSEWFLPAAKHYVQDGTVGTPADRQEAMQAMHKVMFRELYPNANPDDNGQGTHVYTNHYLIQEDAPL